MHPDWRVHQIDHINDSRMSEDNAITVITIFQEFRLMTQTLFHPPVEDPDSPIAGLLGGPRYPGDIIGSVVGLGLNSWALTLVPRGFRSKLRDL